MGDVQGLQTLRLVTCQAPNSEGLYAELAQQLSLVSPVVWKACNDVDWTVRAEMLRTGAAPLGVACPAHYVYFADAKAADLEPLVAGVPVAPRYQDRAYYASDVVVRADKPWRRLDDLRGRVWGYNEPFSHSGWGVTAALLRRNGMDWSDVQARATGGHETSIARLLDGQLDVATLDSTVLDLAMRERPDLASKLRVVIDLGVSPGPPLMLSRSVSPAVRQALLQHLTTMHHTEAGAALLAQYQLRRFDAVDDAWYDPIRRTWESAGAPIPQWEKFPDPDVDSDAVTAARAASARACYPDAAAVSVPSPPPLWSCRDVAEAAPASSPCSGQASSAAAVACPSQR